MSLIELTVDGEKVEVPAGSMVMHAAQKLDKYVPHFCYHPKLSIAANCRMCLVEVEKAPKPLPACATPVSQGMVVHTQSHKAVDAQKGVMEFLLANHPLDCPICDQGGECQLQDLAVGYGASKSRYTEEKRVVFHKPMGPLISAQEMSRCIHCTRCVRFGQEVAGVMELGMLGRGEHSEITSFVGHAVESELSGNMIDVCPVGALTNKPFRYEARTWELSRRKTISGWDAFGSHLVMQTKSNQVKRIVPFEVEELNQCWISDKDRFAYEGLNSPDRLTKPMIKRRNHFEEITWQEALDMVVQRLKNVKESNQTGASKTDKTLVLASSFVSTEELFLLKKLAQAVGISNLDTRLRYSQEQPAQTKGAAWLGLPISDVSTLDFVLVVGSFLRREHPLLAARVRDAANRGATIASIYPAKDDWHLKLTHQLLARPSEMPVVLSALVFHVAKQKNLAIPSWAADNLLFAEVLESLTEDLVQSEKGVIWLGAQAYLHSDAKTIHQMAAWITQHTGLTLGFLPDSANRVGAQVLGYELGAPALKQQVDQALDLLVLWNVEPRRDVNHVAQMARLTQSAEFVVATAMYQTQLEQMDVDLILPVVPFTETPGSFINFEGRLQAFEAVVPPLGEAKEAWRLLRRLATMLSLENFDYQSIDDVRADVVKAYSDLPACLNNEPLSADVAPIAPSPAEFERLAEVGTYATDPIVRRAASLQQTKQAQLGRAFVNQNTVNRYSLKVGAMMRVVHRGAVDVANNSSVIVPCGLDNSLMDGVVRLALNQDASETLSGFSDAIDIVAVS